MRHLLIKSSSNADAVTIASLVARAYISYFYESSVLVFSDLEEDKSSELEDPEESFAYDQLINDSVDSDDYLDYLDIGPVDCDNKVLFKSLKKFFASYELVIIVSNSYPIHGLLQDSKLLIVFEPDEKSITEISDFDVLEESFLVLNQNEFEEISPVLRDEIADLDLKLIAKFQNKYIDENDPSLVTYDDALLNTEKILRALEYIL